MNKVAIVATACQPNVSGFMRSQSSGSSMQNTRDRLAVEIKQAATSWSVAFVDVDEIDTINIYWAGVLAMRRAVAALSIEVEHLLIDARPGA